MSDPNYWGDVQREADRDRGFTDTNYLAWTLLLVAVAFVGCALAVFW